MTAAPDGWTQQPSGIIVWLHDEQPVAILVGEDYESATDTRFWNVEVAVLPERDTTAVPIKTRTIDERGSLDEDEAIENAKQFVEYGGPRELNEPRVQHLVEGGLSRSEAVDWWMTKERGMSQSDWAEKCGCTQQAISDSVSRARSALHLD